MTPNHDDQSMCQPAGDEPADLAHAGFPSPESEETRQQELWRQYRLQQQRRSCPGCGEGDELY